MVLFGNALGMRDPPEQPPAVPLSSEYEMIQRDPVQGGNIGSNVDNIQETRSSYAPQQAKTLTDSSNPSAPLDPDYVFIYDNDSTTFHGDLPFANGREIEPEMRKSALEKRG